jgi:hypothetical protein
MSFYICALYNKRQDFIDIQKSVSYTSLHKIILVKHFSLSFNKMLLQQRSSSSMNSHRTTQAQNVTRKWPAYFFLSIIILAFAILCVEAELRVAIPLLVGVTATVTIVLAYVLYYGERGGIAWSPYVILAVALLLRLMFLFAPPQLSDDIYRYQWDGSNLLQGSNPYAEPPSKVAPPPALSGVHSRINHPEYVTIYPPAAQMVFAAGAALKRDIPGIKGFLVLLDMALCALLILLLRRLELPVWLAVLYAWNPLPVLEIAGSGHVDGAGLTMLIGSFCLLAINRKNDSEDSPKYWPFLLSGALIAGAGLVKLFPFVLTPVLFLLVPAGSRKYFVAGFLAALAALVLPFLPHLINITGSLNTYARNWEFAGFAFNSLRGITGSGTYARLILLCFFLLVYIAILHRLVKGIRHDESPSTRARRALQACYAVAMSFLLLTPTLQPWYALYLVVLLPFCPGPAGLVLGWAVFLAYQVQIPYFILGRWIENPQVTAAIFWAPVTAYLLSRACSGTRQSSVS